MPYKTRQGFQISLNYDVSSVRFPIISTYKLNQTENACYMAHDEAWIDFKGYGKEQLLLIVLLLLLEQQH